jgi:glycosyltransferase involved in cell wall biosynthesis
VAKKGYPDLLTALAQLPKTLAWRFEHIGGGPDREALKAQAAQLSLDAHIDWRGPLPQDQVLERLRAADLFVLPSRITADGDRDGLPNVLMEAQSQAVACISTTISGIPELIDDGDSGALVPPNDPAALAATLLALIQDPALRQRYGAAGRKRVVGAFSHNYLIEPLLARFAHRLAPLSALAS